jgi:hypothetical protein
MSAIVTFDVPGGASMTIPRWPWTRKETSGTWSRAITSHHGVYSSPEYPQGLKPEMDNVEVIVVVGCHARSCDRYAELNAANLSGAFYWDFKCDDNRASRQVVNFYAKQIAARFLSLSPDWKETAVYKGLQEAVFDITGLKPKEVLKVKALTTGGQKVEHRTSRKALVQSFDVSSSSASILPTAMSALTVSGGGTIKKRGSNSPPPATQTMKKARYDESMVSTSRDPSPIPSGEEPTKFDGLGKRIPKPIKRSHY